MVFGVFAIRIVQRGKLFFHNLPRLRIQVSLIRMGFRIFLVNLYNQLYIFGSQV